MARTLPPWLHTLTRPDSDTIPRLYIPGEERKSLSQDRLRVTDDDEQEQRWLACYRLVVLRDGCGVIKLVYKRATAVVSLFMA